MKHEFAVFIPDLKHFATTQELLIKDSSVVHRLHTVLRLSVGDTVMLFDTHEHMRCTLIAVTRKDIRCAVIERSKNQMLQPALHWLLPLLERDAFEEALYACAAMGATTITPLITTKSRKKWGSQKEYERAERIMIAAAEQSKHFKMPGLTAPRNLQEASVHFDGHKVFFDVAGNHALEVMEKLHKAQIKSLVCLVGPEGDLTQEEKELVAEHDFVSCALTPTVLKASQAVTVGLGLVRSCLRPV